ncbi:MAG: hypothetical protein OHK006_17580 [Thermodesulfovibrionales bacterium]
MKKKKKNGTSADDIVRSQEQWQATIDAVGDYLFVIDRNGTIMRSNLSFARRYGRHPREIIGMNIHDLIDFVLPVTPCCPDGRGGGEVMRRELRIGAGTYALSAFPAQFGDAPVCVYVMKDISEILDLKSKLFHSCRITSLGRLVSGVAHEINNPLTGVIGFAEMLLGRSSDPAVRADVEKIHRYAMRCKKVIDDLMSFARQQPPQKRLWNINELISRTLDLRAYWLRKNSVEVVRSFANIPPMMLDRQQIQLVLLNVLVNAEQAIEAGGRKGRIGIETAVAGQGQTVVVSINDNGCGIPEADINRVFDPFFTTKAVSEGTGLGLAISHGIVQEHGGRIWAESREGGGSTFRIELPLS